MYAIKESSTNQQNKQSLEQACPVTFTLHKIGGRWKALIIYHLSNGPLRYGELKKALDNVTEKMLIQNLRELEADNLVIRDVKPVVPPHVTYSLSAMGEALKPMLNAMAEWGLTYSNNGMIAEVVE